MRFRKINVAGTAWLHDPDLREEAPLEVPKENLLHKKGDKEKRTMPRKRTVTDGGRKSTVCTLKNYRPAVPKNDSNQLNMEKRRNGFHGGNTEEMLEYIQIKPRTIFARRVRFFLLSIALCHTCLLEKGINGKINFQAASPDELALAKAAQDLGYLVVDRQSYNITIRTYLGGPDSDPVYETYDILDVIEFSSTRKRMSIVIRMPDQKICVFCKGADTVIQRLLRLSGLATEKCNEIEQRVGKRRSVEAQQAMRRASTSRASISALGPSVGGGPSVTRGRLPSIRDDIAYWLKDRENEGQASPTDNSSMYYSPRPLVQLLADRQSRTRSEGGPFFEDEQIDQLVEETLGVNDDTVFERCFQHINDFANEGLRTLLYAYRYVDEVTYASWRKSYQEAATSLANRQSLIEQAGDQLEQDLELIGATAIEDKLRKGVPEAIDTLRRANIRIWMLTGD